MTKIKVCDAIMGSGKSSAAINYMNSHPYLKFIYITPYLTEVERIVEACPELRFREPNNKLPEYGFKKFQHTKSLIEAGENIASTHSMFLRYSEDMVELIKKHGYTLIVDESMDVFVDSGIRQGDMQLLDDAGWVSQENGTICIKPTFEYNAGRFISIVSLAKGNRLIDIPDLKEKEHILSWIYSADILQAFDEIIVLTYMFDAQVMKMYFDLIKKPFDYIGIEIDEDGKYQFSDTPKYIPEYTKSLSEKIHIFENKKINAIGDNRTALSHNWFKGADVEKKERLKNNVRNFFIHYNKEFSTNSRLWATFDNGKDAIRGMGYSRCGIAFNTKATNEYKNRQILAYCANVFMHPAVRNYLSQRGVDVKEDRYALSIMVQWIWRSAIRDGKDIWIYVPSKRMRTLLKEWIAEVENNYKNTKGE